MTIEQARAVKRRERILDAALRVFSRKGYHEAGVDEIATSSGTSKGGVYFHFPGKQQLFMALLDRSANRLLEKVETAMARERDPIDRADAALITLLSTFARHRPLARLFMVEALGAGPDFHRRVLELHERFSGLIRQHLDEAIALGVIEPVDTEVASRAWFGSLNEVITAWVLSGRGRGLEEAYAALRPLLMRSVGVQAPVTAGTAT
jgi:TetR/AcrR family fatty acid metabolism transcriptional regulator